ncbi:hypothetical protein KY284_000743 [Solanum tuberosum]|nr:hypothetical protein KY284_000743 [Solanum tuberosum]
MLGKVLSIQITLRSVPDLQFSRISGESSFSEDNSPEFLFSIFSPLVSVLLDLVGACPSISSQLEKAGNSVDDPSLHDIAKLVAKNCKGLPITIVTVARALKCKSRPSWKETLVELQISAPINIPQEDSDILPEQLLTYGMGLGIF